MSLRDGVLVSFAKHAGKGVASSFVETYNLVHKCGVYGVLASSPGCVNVLIPFRFFIFKNVFFLWKFELLFVCLGGDEEWVKQRTCDIFCELVP